MTEVVATSAALRHQRTGLPPSCSLTVVERLRTLIAVTAFTLLAAPGSALAATGDLSFVAGPAGCWKPPSHLTAGCTSGNVGLESPEHVLVSPDGRSVYVAGRSTDGSSGRLAAFARDASTGELTPLSGTQGCITADGSGGECTAVAALLPVKGLAISPDGASLYAAVDHGSSDTADGVLVFARNATTGALTLASCVNSGGTLGCSTAAWLADASSAAVSADGASVYVGALGGAAGEGTVAAFSRSTGTGALTAVTGSACVTTISSLGGCTQVPDFQLWDPEEVQVTPDGTQLIASSGGGISILARNSATGALTSPVSGPTCLIADTGASGNPCARAYGIYDNRAVAISPDGRSIYGVSARASADSGVGILSRTPATGLVAVPTGSASCLTQSGLAFQWPGTPASPCDTGRYTATAQDVVVSPDGRNVYAAAWGDAGSPRTPAIVVLRRDPTTGAITQPAAAVGCLSQSGYAGECLADATHASTIDSPGGLAISPDGANVYVVDRSTLALLVLQREPEPPAPAADDPAASSGASPSAGSSAPGGAATRPKALAGAFRLRSRVGTTTGTVPVGANRITQIARRAGTASRGGATRRAKAVKGVCAIGAARAGRDPRAARRTYRCTIRLAKGTWTVVTTARGKAGVVAETSRRVVVR